MISRFSSQRKISFPLHHYEVERDGKEWRDTDYGAQGHAMFSRADKTNVVGTTSEKSNKEKQKYQFLGKFTLSSKGHNITSEMFVYVLVTSPASKSLLLPYNPRVQK